MLTRNAANLDRVFRDLAAHNQAADQWVMSRTVLDGRNLRISHYSLLMFDKDEPIILTATHNVPAKLIKTSIKTLPELIEKSDPENPGITIQNGHIVEQYDLKKLTFAAHLDFNLLKSPIWKAKILNNDLTDAETKVREFDIAMKAEEEWALNMKTFLEVHKVQQNYKDTAQAILSDPSFNTKVQHFEYVELMMLLDDPTK